MTWIWAIDPGPEYSALVRMLGGHIEGHCKLDNDAMRDRVYNIYRGTGPRVRSLLAIEMLASYGMPVGKEVFETCVWIGRFIEAWSGGIDGSYELIYRATIKTHLCGSPRAKDANVRQALIDRFGPGKERAIGRKKAPGPLYGVKADVWSALAVAVTAADLRSAKERAA